MNAAWTLCARELKRFYRDPARVVGAIAPPVLFWFLIGSGLGASVKLYFYSGTLVLIVLFTSVFSTISIIEDRREGFLQAVLVAPIPRLALVLGKVLGASAVGFLQGLFFLLLAPAAGVEAGAAGYAAAAVALLLCAVALTGLGFCIAWVMDSTQGFHAVMNLFLIPLWMLSGAIFPFETAPGWLKLVMQINPLTYGVHALQQSVTAAQAQWPLETCFLRLFLFAAAMLAAATWVARSKEV